MKVLITGGAGYIGSTVASACLDNGITPVILDDFSTGRPEFADRRLGYSGDAGDGRLLDRIFAEHPDIDAIVHCAARVVVPESISRPLDYYRDNVAKTIDLIDSAIRNGCRQLVFSSSAAVYAPNPDLSVTEDSPVDPQSPYARTKVVAEQILADVARAHPIRVLALRYFNPIGADPQLRTGPIDPSPTHVLGKLIEAYEANELFTITGVDWPTRDGSAIRDYIHVWDLAEAHVCALQHLDDVRADASAYDVVNLGTGSGTTVRELVAAFHSATEGRPQVRAAGRRAGDVVGCYANSDKARRLLGWAAAKSIDDAVRDALAWMPRRRELFGA